jgi:hypothetical protein
MPVGPVYWFPSYVGASASYEGSQGTVTSCFLSTPWGYGGSMWTSPP